MDLEAGEHIFFKKGKLGKKLLLNYKNSRGFEPIFFHPPTQVEVDRFPSGSITLDKDSVGVHEQYGGFFLSLFTWTWPLMLMAILQQKKTQWHSAITHTRADPERSLLIV